MKSESALESALKTTLATRREALESVRKSRAACTMVLDGGHA